MILKESDLDDFDIIRPILGKPYKEAGKLFTITGSTIYFLKSFTDLDDHPIQLKREEMKAIFQRYEKGLFLYLTKSNYQNGVLIPSESLKKITLYKNVEKRPIPYPFLITILNTFSTIPILKFLVKAYTFKVNEMVLELETESIKAKMICSYSSFESQVKYFNKLGYKDKIHVKY